MSTFTLSGNGVQTLSANVTALHVTISTLPTQVSHGTANPTNYYHVAMLRFGDGTAYWRPFPVEGGPQWFGCPNGTTQLGYSVQVGGVLTVTEVIGGISPFQGPTGSTGPAGAAGTSYSTLITSQILGSNQATVTFSSIPATYSHLWLLIVGRSSTGSANTEQVRMRFNGDSNNNYDWWYETIIVGTSLAITSSVGTSGIRCGLLTAGTAGTNEAGCLQATIYDYTRTTFNHLTEARSTLYYGSASAQQQGYVAFGHWRSTAAITSIALTLEAAGSFITGSRLDLYGVQ